MLTNLIENRGKEFSSLLKIGDYLARSLRENTELFCVEGGLATYVTESGMVLTGKYTLKPSLKLTKIKVEDSSILEDREAFDKVTNKKVSDLLSNLIEDDYQNAEGSFDEMLSLWETKLSFNRIKERLKEKTERFGDSTKIVSSPEFQRVAELKEQIITFLKENQQIAKIPEIKNGMKLATVVSRAFDIPKITKEILEESRVFEVKAPLKTSIYEHLCRQELIAKELLETRSNFDKMWVSNDKIHELASMVYEDKESTVREQVAKIVCDIPYFSLATKKQIGNLISNSLSLSEIKVSKKDVSTFVGKVYEMKKPVKVHVLKILNEKYGVNINNLTETPTFENLLKTENVILNSIGKLAPKNSVIKKSLFELAASLKAKNGAEAIDLADFLNEVFKGAGYTDSLNETSLTSYMDFNKVADDLGKIGQVLKMIMPQLGGGQPGMDPAAGADPMAAGDDIGAENPMAGDPMGGEDPTLAAPDMTPELDQDPTMGADPLGSPDPMQSGEEGPSQDGILPDPAEVAKDISLEDAGESDPLAGDEGIPGQDGLEDEEEGIPGEEEEEGLPGEDPMEEDPESVEQIGSDELTQMVASIEDVLSDLKAELGDPSVDGEGDEGFDPSEDFGDEEGGEEEGEFGDDEDSDDEFEDDEEEEESPFPKKKK